MSSRFCGGFDFLKLIDKHVVSKKVEVVNLPNANTVRTVNAAAMHAPHTEALTEQDQ